MSKLVITLLSACCFAATTTSALADDLADAREAYQTAKKEYATELKKATVEAKRDGDAEIVKKLESEQSSLNVGVSLDHMAGTWIFYQSNGRTRQYVIHPDGRVQYPREQLTGRLARRQGRLLLKFAGDDKVEVLRLAPALMIDHYDPASNLGKKPPSVTGVAVKIR